MWDNATVAPLYFPPTTQVTCTFFWLCRYTVMPCPLIQHSCIICICHNLSYVVISKLSPPLQITHISQFNNPGSSQAGNTISIPSFADRESLYDNTATDQQSKHPNVVHIGAALLPICIKLLKQIEQGNFIEMAELLPENLGHLATDDDQLVVKPKRWIILDIVEWLQCFGTYIAIIYIYIYVELTYHSNWIARLSRPYNTGISRVSRRFLAGVWSPFRSRQLRLPPSGH